MIRIVNLILFIMVKIFICFTCEMNSSLASAKSYFIYCRNHVFTRHIDIAFCTAISGGKFRHYFGVNVIEFAHLKNTCISSEQSGYGTDLSSILQAIDEQTLLPPEQLRDFFWDMFIADAMLGNFDRHNGNWGILVDEQLRTSEIAPIYDCGSCLFPQLAVKDMDVILNSDDEINRRVYVFPNSPIEENGKKIPYFDFISSLKNADCNAALK